MIDDRFAAATAFMPFLRSDVEQTLVARFAQQVEARPDSPAVLTPFEAWTYAELDARVSAIAAAILDRCGYGSAPIALALEQGAPLAAVMLGVLAAGKFYVPLDSSEPRGRQEAVLRACTPALVIADEGSVDRFATAGAGATPLWSISADPPAPVARRPEVSIGRNDAAYVYFTSGTTGRPKGVIDSHRNVLHNVHRYTNALHIAPDDRLTLLQPPIFSGTVSSLFSALLSGAVLLPFDVRRHGLGRLADWIRRSRATIYHSVPSLFRAVVAQGGEFPDVRVVRLEGDGATRHDQQLLRRSFRPDCILAHGLGTTETGLACQFQLRCDTPLRSERLPIGYPLPDIELRIVDDKGDALPEGTVGEIEVTSEFLALGYWRDSAMTDRRFVAVGGRPGLRRYRTGDLGVVRDGQLSHLGRVDGGIKINGRFVSTLEIESALSSLDPVRHVVVLPFGGSDASEPQVVAYVVLAGGEPPNFERWRARLADRLPAHLIPSQFVPLEALPLTPHGKIDVAALPPPGAGGARSTVTTAPTSEAERRVANAWEEVLGQRPIGIDDNFFDRGGDSLKAAIVAARLEHLFKRPVRPTLLLETPTIRGLLRTWDAPPACHAAERDLVVFRAQGARRPLFLIDWPGGGGWQLGPLVARLGDDQPCYGFVSGGIAEPWPPHTTIEQLASAIIDAISGVQPEGAIALAGHCYGAIIALEVAHELRRRGRDVACLAMLAISPRDFPTLVSPTALDRFRLLNALTPRDLWRLLKRQVMTRARVVRTRKGQPEDAPDEAPSFTFTVAREQAARMHRPTPYAGHVSCIVSERPLRAWIDDPRSCWSNLGQRVTLHLVPGDERELLTEPGVGTTAAFLRQALDRVGRPESSQHDG